MNPVIGHDIDGRPLRVGDEVVLVNTTSLFRHLEGATTCVFGKSPHKDYPIEIFPPAGFQDGFAPYTRSDYLRKLHNDHRPADESFTEMMDKLKGEVV